MDDQIERVAVALCELDGMNPYYESEPGYFYWHDYVKPAQAAIEAMQGWRPIEEAPKQDDELILAIYAGTKIPYIASWDGYDGEDWVSFNRYFEYTHKRKFEPTHFMPLPTPPKKG